MSDSVKERLKEFLAYKGIGQKRFSESCGLSAGFVNNIVNSIQPKTLERISMQYPELNTTWILTGEGNMLKNTTVQTKGIRYHGNIEGTASKAIVFDDEREENFQIMNIPGFEDCTDAINVWGDSMYPVLKSGEIIILKEWKESFINYGKIYLVVTRNGNRMIKYLKPAEENGMIKCVSENPEHPAFEVPLKDILKIYLVKGHIEKCAI